MPVSVSSVVSGVVSVGSLVGASVDVASGVVDVASVDVDSGVVDVASVDVDPGVEDVAGAVDVLVVSVSEDVLVVEVSVVLSGAVVSAICSQCANSVSYRIVSLLISVIRVPATGSVNQPTKR